MPKIEQSLEISASPQKIWSIVADWSNNAKLAPDVLSTEADPPGLAAVGQKIHQVAKVGGRRVDLYSEVVDAEQPELLSTRFKPGRLFKALTFTVTIQPTQTGSLVKFANEYEVSLGYFGKIANKLALDRVAKKNSDEMMKNLKEIAELEELPGAS